MLGAQSRASRCERPIRKSIYHRVNDAHSKRNDPQSLPIRKTSIHARSDLHAGGVVIERRSQTIGKQRMQPRIATIGIPIREDRGPRWYHGSSQTVCLYLSCEFVGIGCSTNSNLTSRDSTGTSFTSRDAPRLDWL